MQVKLIIGTVAFMLTMIIFGYAALREPARMELYTNAYQARQVEFGASLYYNNCSSCHGEQGKAEVCYDSATGEQIGCAGRALNTAELLCDVDGDKPKRITDMQWDGTTAGYIQSTILAGRAQNGMPTWGSRFGGPFEDYQVEYVTQFVLNWQTEALCAEPPPEPIDWPTSVTELPPGNAANGEQLYNVTYGCAACHGQLAVEGSNAVGPWVGEFADLGNVRIEGYSAADYLYESILLPSDYISPECPNGPCAGPPSAMPNNFGTRMTELQEMSDMMAYMLGTETFETNGAEITYTAP